MALRFSRQDYAFALSSASNVSAGGSSPRATDTAATKMMTFMSDAEVIRRMSIFP
jgi:hypothetical protein